MANAGFYNVNEYRQYPFVDRPDIRSVRSAAGKFVLPESLIVDCGFILGLDSDFDHAQHVVYLAKLEVTAQDHIFTFKTTAPGASGQNLVFTRSKIGEKYESWVYEDAESAAAPEKDCADEPVWEGFIVTGDLEAASVTSGIYDFEAGEAEPPYVVEPATLQTLVKSYLRSIRVGNYSRTVIPECPDEDTAATPTTREIIPQTDSCLKGDIQFVAGVNCRILQTDLTNTITIGPLLGANSDSVTGIELCENHGELPLFAEEAAPPGSQFLSGGPACNELISTINGVSGPAVVINAGAGITLATRAVTDENGQETTQQELVIGVSDVVISQTC